jgi:diguanylate cyclase (GGDEF)-like protein
MRPAWALDLEVAMTQIVLVIENANDDRDTLETALALDGMALRHAHDADEGLRMARALLPDLVLLDVSRPLSSALEICKRLKAEPLTRAIPVVFVATEDRVDEKVAAFEAGGVDYVTRPYQPLELRARIRSALRTKRYQDHLTARAQVDALTGLWNRAYFDRRLDQRMERYRHGDGDFGLVLVDIDHFKAINDAHGHPVGDQVIGWIGDLLQASVRGEDSACRYGGEEFAVILEAKTHRDAFCAADRLRAAISSRVFSASVPKVTVSVGVGSTAGATPGTFTRAELLARVDDALYLAKRSGRDRVCPMVPILPRMLSVEGVMTTPSFRPTLNPFESDWPPARRISVKPDVRRSAAPDEIC